MSVRLLGGFAFGDPALVEGDAFEQPSLFLFFSAIVITTYDELDQSCQQRPDVEEHLEE